MGAWGTYVRHWMGHSIVAWLSRDVPGVLALASVVVPCCLACLSTYVRISGGGHVKIVLPGATLFVKCAMCIFLRVDRPTTVLARTLKYVSLRTECPPYIQKGQRNPHYVRTCTRQK